MANSMPDPQRVVASNGPSGDGHQEPAVDILVDILKPESIFGGVMARASIATHSAIPASNDGSSWVPALSMTSGRAQRLARSACLVEDRSSDWQGMIFKSLAGCRTWSRRSSSRGGQHLLPGYCTGVYYANGMYATPNYDYASGSAPWNPLRGSLLMWASTALYLRTTWWSCGERSPSWLLPKLLMWLKEKDPIRKARRQPVARET